MSEFSRRHSVRVLILNLPVNINAAEIPYYLGHGLRKPYAKDAAAHAYLIANQVILPPPLAPLNY
jgi:hypothetical protein